MSVRRRHAAVALVSVLAVALPVAGCASGAKAPSTSERDTGSSSATSTTVPGRGGGGIGDGDDDWKTVDAASVGLDPKVLGAIADEARSGESSCLLVARHGRIAGEWYFGEGARDRPQEVFSSTKSFTSILVGIAQDRGDLRIDDPAWRYVPQWKDTPAAAVTVRNLLSNDSGRSWSYAQDYVQLVQAPDKTGFAVGLEQSSPPGDVWVYNNSAIQTLDRVLRTATGAPTDRFGTDHLLRPIGMDHSSFSTDGAGNTLTFMGLHSTCRDMARFGELLLHQGRWNGKQVVSKAYVTEATKPSQSLNEAYGFLIWLNRKGHLAGATSPGTAQAQAEQPDAQMVPGAPQDMFWALGLGGQVIQVDKGTDTVVVRLGSASLKPTFDQNDTARVVTEAVRR